MAQGAVVTLILVTYLLTTAFALVSRRRPTPLPTVPCCSHTLQAAERQGGELSDAQSHVQALEAELEGKAREGAALLADTLALKARHSQGTWSGWADFAHNGLLSACRLFLGCRLQLKPNPSPNTPFAPSACSASCRRRQTGCTVPPTATPPRHLR